MPAYKIKVLEQDGVFDAVGQGVLKDIQDLGLPAVTDVRFAQLYYIDGRIDETQVRHIAEELLIDRITQEYSLTTGDRVQGTGFRGQRSNRNCL